MSINVKGNELVETYITGAEIFSANKGIIDNFQQALGYVRDFINNLLKSLLIGDRGTRGSTAILE